MDKIKKLFLGHGEKIVLGGVAITVLAIIGMTNWVPYDRRPIELETKVNTAKAKVDASTWPEAEKVELDKLDQDDTRNLVVDVFSPVPLVAAAPSVEPLYSITGEEQPAREPVWTAVKQLVATSGIVILSQRTDAPELEAVSLEDLDPDATKPEEEKPDGSDIFTPRTSSGVGSSGIGVDLTGTEEVASPLSENFGSEGEMSEDGELGSGGLPSGLDAKVYRYAAVRGVFSRDEQIQKIKDALGVPYQTAENNLEIVDFEIDRQTAQPGKKDPWSGPWEKLDAGVAFDVANRAAEIDPDPVSEAIKHPVITMPLPSRLMGTWRNHADHPQIKNFVLSPEEMEVEMRLNNKLISEQLEELEKQAAENRTGGFSGLQYGVAGAQREVFGNTNSQNRQAQALLKELEEEIKAAGGELNNLIKEKIKARVSAAGRLLLFRYIDFTVEPGESYRYRVRLVMRNPNYDRPIESAVHPAVVAGAFRTTPASEASDPVYVENNVQYFLTAARAPRGTSTEPSAQMSVYEWSNETGTLVSDQLEVEIGQRVGGTTKTHVLRPAEPKFEQEEITLQSKDTLVDINFDDKVDRDFHTDLAMPDRAYGSLGIEPLSLLVDPAGNFVEKDPISNSRDEQEIDRLYELQKETWDFIIDAIKNAEEEAENTLDGSEYIDEYSEESEMGLGLDRYKKSGRNSNRNRRNAASMRGSGA